MAVETRFDTVMGRLRKVALGLRILGTLSLLGAAGAVGEPMLREGAVISMDGTLSAGVGDALTLAIPLAIAAIVCFSLASVPRRLQAANARMEEEAKQVEARTGAYVFIESVGTGEDRRLLRVFEDAPESEPPVLDRHKDLVISQGGDGLIIGVTVFTWAFLSVLIISISDGIVGNSPNIWQIVGLPLVTLLAVAAATLRKRVILSNKETRVRSVLSCLWWSRGLSWSSNAFADVRLRHRIIRGSARGTRTYASSSSMRHEFQILLHGAEDVHLESRPSPFTARRRARQIAAYLGKPFFEPVPQEEEVFDGPWGRTAVQAEQE